MTAKILYKGQLRTESIHLSSGTTILSDAPVDNHGLGTTFSPTDLIVSSLASCMLTIMGIKADQKEWDLKDSYIEATKIMYDTPRRIGEIHLEIHIHCTTTLTLKDKKILEHAADTCPVLQSIHPDIKVIRNYHFN